MFFGVVNLDLFDTIGALLLTFTNFPFSPLAFNESTLLHAGGILICLICSQFIVGLAIHHYLWLTMCAHNDRIILISA